MKNHLYEHYKKIRDLRGLTDAAVAKQAGIGRSTFSDWKSGRSAPKQEKLNKIAAVLSVAPDYFITGNETATSKQPFSEIQIDFTDPIIYSIIENMEKMNPVQLSRLERYVRLLMEAEEEANKRKEERQ